MPITQKLVGHFAANIAQKAIEGHENFDMISNRANRIAEAYYSNLPATELAALRAEMVQAACEIVAEKDSPIAGQTQAHATCELQGCQ